jgi:hypothetical protein
MRIKNKEVIALKKKLKKNKIKGLAVDVDDTLSLTFECLVDELSKKMGNSENLPKEEMFLKYRSTWNVPDWRNEKAEEIVHKIITSDELQKDLPLIENANNLVLKVNKVIPVVAYITARPNKIRNGTEFWLKKYGFVKACLIMKFKNKKRGMSNRWKAGVLKYLYPEVQGIVDDNLGLINALGKGYKGRVFLYKGSDCKRKYNYVVLCKDWDDVLDKVKKEFNDGNG